MRESIRVGMEYTVYFLLILHLVESLSARSRLEADTQTMKKQLTLQNQHFIQLTQSIEKARRARHDLRHHLSVISGFAEKGEIQVLLKYLEDYRGSLSLDMEPPLCANYVVDILARHYFAQAREAGADTDIRLTLPEVIRISDADLCIIFGNIFENAVNAVKNQKKGEKFIRVRCDCENESVVLIVDNSTTAKRKNERGSGIGISSVREAAKRYDGSTVFAQKDGVYQSCVMLSLMEDLVRG